ncbi:hypothetical protein ACTFIN_12915 [Clostridium cagae]|uniref:hypothetical protein n=1 Tax=Clostridium cagae TaxID=2080751 RepID=UPI0013FBB420|nr:hypothetical protein [Clostridium botulinum]NFO53565.1 hypothetical protein [Clostridium botulinum]
MYFRNYPTKELADELQCSIKEIKDKAYDLDLIEKLSPGFKKCKDCGEIKRTSEFHKHSTLSLNCYCKHCDTIRRRNNAILKKIKAKIDSELEKKAKAEFIKINTSNILLECTHCKKQKLGSEFYFDSSNLKRFSICISCTKIMRESKEIEKIKKRGY